MEPHSLKALVVFKNYLYPELIRTVHFYKLEEGMEKEVEREYLFYDDSPYEEMSCCRVFTLRKFCISEQFEGLINGVWLCVFVFDAGRCYSLDLNNIPTILSIHRNSKLETVPTLANDLRIIFEMNTQTVDKELSNGGISLDLNLVPSLEPKKEEIYSPSEKCSELSNMLPTWGDGKGEEDGIALDMTSREGLGVAEDKKTKAKHKDVANISIEDLSKHFDLPIIEASKILKVGLTVLKKKCREFGIPRWPHRKIKSLDGLIRDLQEEVKEQQKEDESAAAAVAKRQRMIENEKESIERKPFLDMRWEIKKIRQDIFKKRHKARAREIYNQTSHPGE